MLKKCIKIELKKALCNKMAVVAFIFVIALSVMHAIGVINTYNHFMNALESGNLPGNPMITAVSLFARWIGADVTSFESNVFFFLIPIVAVLPYGWSLAGEMHSGYTKNIVCRMERKYYFISKYVAVFISAAVVVLIPLLINFLLLSLFLPSLKMEIIYPYGILGQRSMWSNIYYENPLLYTMLYIVLDTVFAGLIASVSTALAFFVKYKVPVMLIPFFALLFIDYLDMSLWNDCEFSPIKFLHALPVTNDRFGWVILLEAVILLIATMGTVLYKEGKYEVL